VENGDQIAGWEGVRISLLAPMRHLIKTVSEDSQHIACGTRPTAM
jgi:hypothetical protein